jgi:hypothetical protein
VSENKEEDETAMPAPLPTALNENNGQAEQKQNPLNVHDLLVDNAVKENAKINAAIGEKDIE